MQKTRAPPKTVPPFLWNIKIDNDSLKNQVGKSIEKTPFIRLKYEKSDYSIEIGDQMLEWENESFEKSTKKIQSLWHACFDQDSRINSTKGGPNQSFKDLVQHLVNHYIDPQLSVVAPLLSQGLIPGAQLDTLFATETKKCRYIEQYYQELLSYGTSLIDSTCYTLKKCLAPMKEQCERDEEFASEYERIAKLTTTPNTELCGNVYKILKDSHNSSTSSGMCDDNLKELSTTLLNLHPRRIYDHNTIMKYTYDIHEILGIPLYYNNNGRNTSNSSISSIGSLNMFRNLIINQIDFREEYNLSQVIHNMVSIYHDDVNDNNDDSAPEEIDSNSSILLYKKMLKADNKNNINKSNLESNPVFQYILQHNKTNTQTIDYIGYPLVYYLLYSALSSYITENAKNYNFTHIYTSISSLWLPFRENYLYDESAKNHIELQSKYHKIGYNAIDYIPFFIHCNYTRFNGLKMLAYLLKNNEYYAVWYILQMIKGLNIPSSLVPFITAPHLIETYLMNNGITPASTNHDTTSPSPLLLTSYSKDNTIGSLTSYYRSHSQYNGGIYISNNSDDDATAPLHKEVLSYCTDLLSKIESISQSPQSYLLTDPLWSTECQSKHNNGYFGPNGSQYYIIPNYTNNIKYIRNDDDMIYMFMYISKLSSEFSIQHHPLLTYIMNLYPALSSYTFDNTLSSSNKYLSEYNNNLTRIMSYVERDITLSRFNSKQDSNNNIWKHATLLPLDYKIIIGINCEYQQHHISPSSSNISRFSTIQITYGDKIFIIPYSFFVPMEYIVCNDKLDYNPILYNSHLYYHNPSSLLTIKNIDGEYQILKQAPKSQSFFIERFIIINSLINHILYTPEHIISGTLPYRHIYNITTTLNGILTQLSSNIQYNNVYDKVYSMETYLNKIKSKDNSSVSSSVPKGKQVINNIITKYIQSCFSLVNDDNNINTSTTTQTTKTLPVCHYIDVNHVVPKILRLNVQSLSSETSLNTTTEAAQALLDSVSPNAPACVLLEPLENNYYALPSIKLPSSSFSPSGNKDTRATPECDDYDKVYQNHDKIMSSFKNDYPRINNVNTEDNIFEALCFRVLKVKIHKTPFTCINWDYTPLSLEQLLDAGMHSSLPVVLLEKALSHGTYKKVVVQKYLTDEGIVTFKP